MAAVGPATDDPTAGTRFRVVPAAYVALLRAAGAGREVLLQLRSGTGYRDGHWSLAAAGHVEVGETVVAAACREAAEELGIAIAPGDLTPATVMHRTGGHGLPIDERVDFFFTCTTWTGEPRVVEPHHAAGLGWYALDALPEPTVPHERHVLTALGDGTLAPVTTWGFAAGEG